MKEKITSILTNCLKFDPNKGIIGIEEATNEIFKYIDEEYMDGDMQEAEDEEEKCSCNRFQGQLTDINPRCGIHGHTAIEL